MSPEPSDRPNQDAAATESPRQPLPFSEPSKRVEVPSFRCLVYLARQESGRVRARVANLPGIQCEVSNEREALAAIIPRFKQQIAEAMAAETPIPWIEPPAPLEPGEQKRIIPVHL